MTAYSICTIVNSDSGESVAIQANAYELKIARVEAYNNLIPTNSTFLTAAVSRYSGSTVSGGSVFTPTALRGGAPAASASCRFGPVSVSGTSALIAKTTVAAAQTGVVAPPFDLTIPVGSALAVKTTNNATGTFNALVTIYFEELRLAWHY
jgi:hypothetical protein